MRFPSDSLNHLDKFAHGYFEEKRILIDVGRVADLNFDHYLCIWNEAMHSSPIHRLDPRAKILVLVACLAGSFACGVAVLLSWPVLLAGLGLSGVPLVSFAKRLKPVVWLVLAGLALQCLFTPGEPIFTLAGMEVSREGLMRGGALALQLVTAMAFSALLSLTTSGRDIAWGMERLLSPLSRLGLPVGDFFKAFGYAMDFVPRISGELASVKGVKGLGYSQKMAAFGALMDKVALLPTEVDSLGEAPPSRALGRGDAVALSLGLLTLLLAFATLDSGIL